MNNVEKLLAKYKNHTFQSSTCETQEWRTFCTKLKNTMKQDISESYPDLEISAWSKGHFYVSGFITRKSDGAIFYFSIGDVRGWNVATSYQMYRSARHLKDYIGGINRHCLAGDFLKMIATERYEFVERIDEHD